jgi:hypothetical protein
MVSAIVVEKLLWRSGLTLIAFSVIEIPLLLAINAVLWFVIVRAARRLRH